MRLALALLVAAAAASAQTTVSGRVVNAVTGEPVRRAAVNAVRLDGGPVRSAMADTEGQFSLPDLPPGSLRITASRDGFIPLAPGKLLAIDPGRSISDLRIKLNPESIVTGRVVDEEGEPMRNVNISLQQYRFIQSPRQLVTVEPTATTNDLGEYRLFGVAPGQYALSATLTSTRLTFPVVRSAESPAQDTYVTTYFPGTTDASAAAPIRIAPGSQLRGLDLTLVKTPTFHVRGRVVHGMSGRPNVSIVHLVARGSALLGARRASAVDPSGNFDISGVPPGAYTLSATFNNSTGARRARMTIEVRRADIDGLNLTAIPDVSVKGRLISDPGGPPVPLLRVQVSLQPRELDFFAGGAAHGKPDEQGNFEIDNAVTDRYLLSVSGLPPGAFVKSARTGQSDVLAEGLDLTGGAAPENLTVVISPNGATLSGVVQSPGAIVVLIPNESSRRHQSTIADHTGAFSIAGLPPGEYKLYAWEEVAADAWLDPDFLKSFESKGESVTLREGEQKTLTIKAIAAD